MARVIRELAHEQRCSCQHCGAEVAYVKNEVQRRDGTDYGGGPDGCEWIVCPGCHNNITLRSW